jgi:hypothetical protein
MFLKCLCRNSFLRKIVCAVSPQATLISSMMMINNGNLYLSTGILSNEHKCAGLSIFLPCHPRRYWARIGTVAQPARLRALRPYTLRVCTSIAVAQPARLRAIIAMKIALEKTRTGSLTVLLHSGEALAGAVIKKHFLYKTLKI